MDKRIGKSDSLMIPSGEALVHPSASRLVEYAMDGCPADCGKDWELSHIREAVRKGAHVSALYPVARKVLREETMEKVKEGFAKIVKFGDLLRDMPKKLKISPVAMIPHKSRQYRAILDLSFNLEMNGKKMSSVNDGTVSTAPQHSMNELDRVLNRMISLIASAKNETQPFLFSKLDISDGFWRVKIRNEGRWNFCYVLPSEVPEDIDIEDIDIVVPSSLQMGWTESSLFLCNYRNGTRCRRGNHHQQHFRTTTSSRISLLSTKILDKNERSRNHL